ALRVVEIKDSIVCSNRDQFKALMSVKTFLKVLNDEFLAYRVNRRVYYINYLLSIQNVITMLLAKLLPVQIAFQLAALFDD
ncbi:hypothetical protein L9F63_023789, partial [Diploptera punctata]